MYAVLLFGAFALIECQTKFEAYDCRKPQDIRMMAHENCHVHSGHLEVKDYVIIQNNRRKNTTGYTCEITETVLVDYCGHYSSTKATGQSTIHVPKMVSEEECRNMAMKGVHTVDGVAHSVRMNSMNHISWFSHGSVKFDGDNIECQGQSIRLHNGQINKNMIRQVIQEVKIQKVQIIVDNNQALLQSGEVIGNAYNGYGTVDAKSVIWTAPQANECQKSIITTLKLTSRDGTSYINKDHMIKIDKKNRAYNPQCKISYWETNDKNLHIMDVKDADKLQMFDKSSVLVSSHIQTQLDFLGSRVASVIKDAYSVAMDPQCHEINLAPLHKTLKLSANKYTRNLGDISVVFTCKPLTVELDTNHTQCFVHPPILMGNNEAKYIDPETRIIIDNSIPTACSRDSSPILKATNGQFYAISPKPIEITPDQNKLNDNANQQKTHGLYPQEVVEDWLANAYLPHITRSYSLTYEWGKMDKSFNSMVGHLTETYDNLKNFNVKDVLLGLNFDHIGAQCGVASLCILIALLGYWTVELALKLILVHDKTKSYKQTFVEAGFGHLRVLSQWHKKNVDKDMNKDYDDINL